MPAKKSVLVVTRVERFELPNEEIANWAADVIESSGGYYTDGGWSMHDAGNFIGETVTTQVET